MFKNFLETYLDVTKKLRYVFSVLFVFFSFFSRLEGAFQTDRVLQEGCWKLEVIRSLPERFSRLSYIGSNETLSLSFHSFYSKGCFYFFCEVHSFCEWMEGKERATLPTELEVCWENKRSRLEGILEVGSQKIWLTPESNQILISLFLKKDKIVILRGTSSLEVDTKGFSTLYHQFCKMRK